MNIITGPNWVEGMEQPPNRVFRCEQVVKNIWAIDKDGIYVEIARSGNQIVVVLQFWSWRYAFYQSLYLPCCTYYKFTGITTGGYFQNGTFVITWK
jgi:hypothetical protein